MSSIQFAQTFASLIAANIAETFELEFDEVAGAIGAMSKLTIAPVAASYDVNITETRVTLKDVTALKAREAVKAAKEAAKAAKEAAKAEKEAEKARKAAETEAKKAAAEAKKAMPKLTAEEKAALKAAKDAEKAAQKAEKDAQKEAEKAEKEAAKAAKKAASEAKKAAVEAEKAARKAARDAKKASAVVVAVAEAAAEPEAETEVEEASNKVEVDGVTYAIEEQTDDDGNMCFVAYDVTTGNAVGLYDPTENTIDLDVDFGTEYDV